jgi:hypothetical protein
VPVAMEASQGEVVQFRLAAMLTRNDMVNVKGKWKELVGKTAIFAPARCSLAPLSEECPCSRMKMGIRLAIKH